MGIKENRELEECVIKILVHGDMNFVTEHKVRKLAAEETGLDLTDPEYKKLVKRVIQDFFVKDDSASLQQKKTITEKVEEEVTPKKSIKDEDKTVETLKNVPRVDKLETRYVKRKRPALQSPTQLKKKRQIILNEDDDEVSGHEEEKKTVQSTSEAEDEELDSVAGQTKNNHNPKKSATGHTFVCQLSETRNVTVENFKGKILVAIREFYDKDGQWWPTKKGISLTLDQWEALRDGFPEVEAAIKRLKQ